ncbi:hypothetical protein L873DRAFT_1841329 [Choiromyces venosus 120613-1]|uniref:Pali-domain-containing protein n=1 Tax=Choiromyces venosus 120613-1 TaxID=1336337 RepID=A0A3N4JYG3_9PEZI|nr:hypothetical protein L873DRAFT_1841329 [Choiromyces venosus 120613-1]
MVSITIWARVATSFCLFMALLLTAFLLSGSTSETSGVRSLYNIELKWIEPTATTDSSTTSTTPLSVVMSVETEARTTTAPQRTTTRVSTRVATNTIPGEPLTADAAAAVTKRGLIVDAGTAVASLKTGGCETLVLRDGAQATGCVTLALRNAPEATALDTESPERARKRWERASANPPAGKGKRPHIVIPRGESTNNPNIHQILRFRDSSPSSTSNATILISYFGLCTYTPETQWQCNTHRAGANSSTILPPTLYALSKALQKTLSPVPPILAIMCLGLLLLTTVALALVNPLVGTRGRILGQVHLGVGLFAIVAGIFTAVLFWRTVIVVFAVLDGMQAEGNGGVIAEKGGSGIAVAWAAVFFEALGFLGTAWLVLCADEGEAGGDEEGTGGLSIFSRIFRRKDKEEEQAHELGEIIRQGGRNSPTFPQNVYPGLRGGDITIGPPLEVRRDVHPLRGTFQRERELSVGSVSSVSTLSDRSRLPGPAGAGGRQQSTISTISDVTTVRGASNAGRGRLESERYQSMRKGNSPFPGGWNKI